MQILSRFQLISYYFIQKDQLNEVNNERKMLTQLKHKSIVGMRAAWVDKTYLYLLLDYALNGDLHSFLKKRSKYFGAYLID